VSNVAGIDLSSFAVDMVRVHDTGLVDWHRYMLEGNDAFDRARRVPDAMPGPTDELWDETMAIGIEQPAGHHGVIPLVRVQGAILARLPKDLLVHPYVPARWRVLAGLPGHALKADVRLLSIAHGGGEQWAQDAHDAHLVARALMAELAAQEKAA
jgi:hypothetical protein